MQTVTIHPTPESPLAGDEPDRATIKANGIVVDVIANTDGTVYVELYAYERGKLAQVQHVEADVYKTRHPNLRVGLVAMPEAIQSEA